MSVQGGLQRPRSASWKVEAIRRGDLKISGPIPIEEDTPLSDEEERQFAERHGEKRQEDTLDVLAAPQHTIRQVPNSQGTLRPEDGTEEIATKTASQDQDFARQELELHDQHPARSPLRSPLGMHPTEGFASQRESVIQPRLHTPPTPFRATPESTSQSNMPANAKKQKRKSGIRSVFRKMFGRKDSRGESQERSQERNAERHEESARRGHSYHHSDPGMLQKSQTAPQQPPTPSAQRISDLTVKELQPPHPLHSLPYPMNVNAPPASPPHEYLRFDFQRPDLGPRRATLPNLTSGIAQRHSLDEPRGRLSTWEEREDEPLPSPGIGIALSSPPHATQLSLKDRRRSRSADALRELAKARFSGETNPSRTDVIKSWRESAASASVYSQNTRPQTARTIETVRSVQTKGPTVQEVESIHEGMSATLVGPDDLTPNEPTPRAQEPTTPQRPAPRAQDWETPEHPPVSAFNFGNLEPSSPHEHPETLAQLEGPALPSRSPERLSVEDRVQHLESNVQALESSLRRISQHTNRQTIILESAPRNLRTRTRSTSRSVSQVSIHQREPLPASSTAAPTSNLSYESSPPSPPLTHTEDPQIGTTLTKETSDLASLHALLDDERTARLALESRVLSLQHEVKQLHDLVNRLVYSSSVAATSPKYPTPSPDSIYAGGEERMPTPRQGRYGARRQGTDDSEIVSPDGEVWATPKEGSFEVQRTQYFEGSDRI
ncbi:hypothetical protein E8E12_011057 [Didymella heteroderae]|uniref:Uncharacterized protein n=1 Tax=Didymella heteroderae TaxID=1769908 RepID=A0A9P4X0A7_9PLEO|nr:hypothetical protein E8E12_011057 [Didymella heteroderae]